MSERAEKAQDLFRQGCNCSQAVAAAYADLFGMDAETAMRAAAGLGGGCGRQRELCGAVSGAVMILGLKYGATQAGDAAGKQYCYEKVGAFLEEFKKTNPSIVCRELLGLSASPSSSYQKRPCAEIVKDSALALEKILND